MSDTVTVEETRSDTSIIVEYGVPGLGRCAVMVTKWKTFSTGKWNKAEVNWSAFGSVSADSATLVSEALVRAVGKARELDLELLEVKHDIAR